MNKFERFNDYIADEYIHKNDSSSFWFIGKYGESIIVTALPNIDKYIFSCCIELGIEDLILEKDSVINLLKLYCIKGFDGFDKKDKYCKIHRLCNIHYIIGKQYKKYKKTCSISDLHILEKFIENLKIFKLTKREFIDYIACDGKSKEDIIKMKFLLQIRKRILKK